MTVDHGTAKKIRAFRILIPVVTFPIYGLIAISYGWQCYATLTELPGLRGTMHKYYNLTIGQYATYNAIVAFASVGLILLQTTYLIDKDPRKITRTFWNFGLFVVLVVVAEIYLHTRFIPKG